VGGSLFDWPHLAAALMDWVRMQPQAVNVLVAGGGGLAEFVRDAHKRFSLDEETSHWMCVDLLSVSAALLASLLPETVRVATLADLREHVAGSATTHIVVLCPTQFLRVDEPKRDHRLPRNWSVTSDSIAARIAEVLSADELVLLKSADPLGSGQPFGGLVDGYFAEAARDLSNVRLVNLRRFFEEGST
jgi:aspartokinase-like uncharacterized kinase